MVVDGGGRWWWVVGAGVGRDTSSNGAMSTEPRGHLWILNKLPPKTRRGQEAMGCPL